MLSGNQQHQAAFLREVAEQLRVAIQKRAEFSVQAGTRTVILRSTDDVIVVARDPHTTEYYFPHDAPHAAIHRVFELLRS